MELSRISEPVTLLTDYLLGGFTIALAIRLLRNNRALAARAWGTALLATGVGAVTGGTYHGFFELFDSTLSASLWKTTLYLIGIAALFLACGAILSTTSGALQRILLAIAVLKFIIYAAWMAHHDEFRFVILDYAPTMVAVAILFALRYRSHPALTRWMLGGIAISFAAAAVQRSGVALHRHFNHNDIYHVVQMAAMYALYRGGMGLRDRQ